MSTMALDRTCFLKISCHEIKIRHVSKRTHASWTILIGNGLNFASYSYSQVSKSQFFSNKGGERTVKRIEKKFLPQLEANTPLELQFDRLQPQDQVLIKENRLEFGQFVARQALVDEEYWTAAWLRAESHWEDRRNDRYADTYKRKFAEQEFNAIKRRSKAQLGHKCTCIVVVNTEDRDVKRTVVKSVVGTLDLSIQHFSYGETFPGEQVKPHLFCSIDGKASSSYGYISNLCVIRSTRRQGIASNMLRFAIESAKADGAVEVFVHVHRDNEPAKELYYKIGFEVVEAASFNQSDKETYLLHFRL